MNSRLRILELQETAGVNWGPGIENIKQEAAAMVWAWVWCSSSSPFRSAFLSPSSDYPVPQAFCCTLTHRTLQLPHGLAYPSFLLDQVCVCLRHPPEPGTKGPSSFLPFLFWGKVRVFPQWYLHFRVMIQKHFLTDTRGPQLGRSPNINKCHSLIAQIGKLRAREEKNFSKATWSKWPS